MSQNVTRKMNEKFQFVAPQSMMYLCEETNNWSIFISVTQKFILNMKLLHKHIKKRSFMLQNFYFHESINIDNIL